VPVLTRDRFVSRHGDPALRGAALDAMAATDRPRRLEAIGRLGAARADAFLDFGERNRIGPIVAKALLEALPDGFSGQSRARRIYEDSGRRMRVMMAELDQVAERLAAAGHRMVALKNAGIARGIFDDPALCPMGDLDVLVSRRRFREAHAVILEAGFTLKSRAAIEAADVEAGLHSGGTEYIKQTGGEEVWFELQWRPVAGRWIRKDQEPDPEALLARSVPIDGSAVRLLSPVDNMIQVGLHTAKHTYVRAPGLRLHTDVDRLAVFTPPDWGAVAAMACALSVKTAVYFSLAMAQALLDTPIPPSVLEALRPPAWKVEAITRWLARVDVFEPDQHKFRRPDMMAFTALLYDDAPGLAASVFDTEPDRLGLRHLPENLGRGARRMLDVVTRFQR
jgi:hypothetical protein